MNSLKYYSGSYSGHCIILHDSEDPPTLVDTQSVIPAIREIIYDDDVEIWIKPQRLQQLGGSAKSLCRSTSDYSEAQCRQLCGEPCHPRTLTCRPQHPTWTPTSHLGSCLRQPAYSDFEYQNLTEELYACAEKCKPRCSRTVYSYSVDYQRNVGQPSYIKVTLRPHANFLPTLTETQVSALEVEGALCLSGPFTSVTLILIRLMNCHSHQSQCLPCLISLNAFVDSFLEQLTATPRYVLHYLFQSNIFFLEAFFPLLCGYVRVCVLIFF